MNKHEQVDVRVVRKESTQKTLFPIVACPRGLEESTRELRQPSGYWGQ